jgi:hypothetical protein
MDPLRSESRWPLYAVLVPCTLGALVACYFLYRDMAASGDRGMGTAIGFIEQCTSDVKRKPASHYLWTGVQEGDPLYAGDSLQTGPRGSVVVRLSDGSSFEMDEDNTVILEDDVTHPERRFSKGSLNVRGKGDNRADGRHNETSPIRLLAPAPLSHFAAADGGTSVNFFWSRPANVTGTLTLQISMDMTFKASKNVETTADRLVVTLNPGHYYWRLLSAKAAVTETRQFWIEKATEKLAHSSHFHLLSPKAFEEVYDSGAGSIRFTWKFDGASTPRDGFLLELSHDSTFQTKVISQWTKRPSFSLAKPLLPPGSYYWRVSAPGGVHGKAEISEASRFTYVPRGPTRETASKKKNKKK